MIMSSSYRYVSLWILNTIYTQTVSRDQVNINACFLGRYASCGFFVLFMTFVRRAFASVHCCLVVLWSPVCKRLTMWLLIVMLNCVFVTFPCSILGHVRRMIVSFPDIASFLTSMVHIMQHRAI